MKTIEGPRQVSELTSPAPARRPLISRRPVVLAAGWAFLLLLLGLWELAGRRDETGYITPSTDVLHQAWLIVTSERLTADILPSLGRALAGFLVGSALGIALGVVLGWSRRLEPWVRPALEFLRAVPPPALVPLAVASFGASTTMRIGVISIGAFWPVLLNATDGVRQVDARYIETARVYTSGRGTQILRRVALPAAAPQIMTGMRIGLAISLILMVISEMVASTSGLGYLILQSQRLYALNDMYAGVLLLGVIGWLLTLVFSAVERRSLRWFDGMKGHTDE